MPYHPLAEAMLVLKRLYRMLVASWLACWLVLPGHAGQALVLQRADGRPLPAMAYAPRSPTCLGLALVSPGAGGAETGYAYLGDALAALGYLALVMGHPESGPQALAEQIRGNGLREGLTELVAEPEAYRDRFKDLDAARAWAAGRCRGSERLLVGHSMGAATVLLEAGARNRLGLQGPGAFTAYVALSPQGVGSVFPQDAWSGIRAPVLSLTGTRDTALDGASWETRTQPFENMAPGCKWLGVVDGAAHMNFAGRGMSRRTEVLVVRLLADFLDGVRRGDYRPVQPPGGLTLRTR